MLHCAVNVRKRLYFYYFCIFLLVTAAAAVTSSQAADNQQQQQQDDLSIDNDEDYLPQKEYVLEKSYHGLVRGNETPVEITPFIKVDIEKKICRLRILKKPFHYIPFEIKLLNNFVVLEATHPLNCEKRRNYHFSMVAVFCDGLLSAPANVHINVVGVNEYAPTFTQLSYETEVDEGYVYKDIIRLEATDKDCSPLYGDICKYEILNKEQPFTIDKEGTIRNTKPLNYKATRNHILSVVAYDCAMKQSAPVMVNIKVQSLCVPKFNNIDEQLTYKQNQLLLFPKAHVELCDFKCNAEPIHTRTSVILETNHLSFGCDRDIALNCNMEKDEKNSVDLLPSNADWLKNTTASKEYYNEMESFYHFNGNNGILVPETVLPQHDFSSQPFSIMTVFRHAPIKANTFENDNDHDNDAKHIKEHLICSADDHKMNRHHMALFVRNCRLILLLRKNFNEGDLNIFSPAEWRWKIPQVCDNKWHHYILNVNVATSSLATKVELYIDGELFVQNSHDDHHNNPEIIDDWPLHAANGIRTKLSIGACYQSSENELKHGFNGNIQMMKLFMNSTKLFNNKNQIKCLTTADCNEHLLAPNENYLMTETQLQVNSQLNEIYIETKSIENLQKLLQQIKYINKQEKFAKRRNVELKTFINCQNEQQQQLEITAKTIIFIDEHNHTTTTAPIMFINMDDEVSNVSDDNDDDDNDEVILEAHEMKIEIKGMLNKLVSYAEIKQGVRILEDVKLTATDQLNACNVLVFPALNPDHEDISVFNDELLSQNLNIKTNINKEGVIMRGHDSLNNYLSILHNLVYSNKKPAYYLNRVFKLSCRQLNANTKNKRNGEYTLTLTVLHPKQQQMNNPTTTAPSTSSEYIHNPQQQHEDNIFSHVMVHSHGAEESQSQIHTILRKVDSSHPTMLIALLCLFVVVLLCGILVVRIRNNNNKYRITRHHQPCPKIMDEGLVWDDSALTITINPMQSDNVSDVSSDSENSDTDDDDDENEIEGTSNINQLEWDNSNIFTSSLN